MGNNDLETLCKNLPYSRSSNMSDCVLLETISALEDLFSVYGLSNTISKLYKIWPIAKAVPFFERILPFMTNSKPIKTIATYNHRLYNGGIERVTAQLATLWTRMGYRVILLTTEPSHPLDFDYPTEKVKRIVIPDSNHPEERLSVLEEIVQVEQVDIIINHQWLNSFVLWECALFKYLSIPYVLYAHGVFSFDLSKYPAIFRGEIFRCCDLVLSLSKLSARYYQLCGCNSYLILNPIPDDLAHNDRVSSLSSNHILFIGRIAKKKRPLDALRIFEIVHKKHPEIILDIVGGDDLILENQMKEFVSANFLDGVVRFHGKKPLSEIVNYYLDAAMVLMTSETEGYPMVVLESKAYGLPLVMYDLPYLSLTQDQKGVLSAPIGSINQMANNVMTLIENETFRLQMGKEARESFESIRDKSVKAEWERVFKLVESGEGEKGKDKNYYNPNNLSDVDRLILPFLTEEFKRKAQNKKKQDKSIDYRVGNTILCVPRFCRKQIIRFLKWEQKNIF